VAGVDGFEVRNNHVHNEMPGYKKEGICLKDGSAHGKVYGNHVHHTVAVGIYLDAWDKHTHNIEVFRNIVHHSLNDGITLASEMGGLLENIRIYNNIAYDNHFIGIALNRNGPASTLIQPLRNVEIINNTLCQNGQSGWGGGISVGNPDVEDIVIRNNICSRNVSFQLAVDTAVKDSELAVDHNLIDGFRGYVDEGGMEIIGSDAREGDSRFADASAANYHLQESSPAVDMGSALSAPDDDMEGNMRPRGAGYDAGAYEYDAGMIEDGHDITVTTGPNGSVSCVPNPVPAGENSICTVAPSAGYRVDAFECDGSPATLADHQYVFNSVTANHTVNVTFKIDLRGDVDHDGIVDPDDAVMLMKVISGMTPVQSMDEDADINGDGKTGLTEVLFILQRAAGLR
jgi:hypothetical protein